MKEATFPLILQLLTSDVTLLLSPTRRWFWYVIKQQKVQFRHIWLSKLWNTESLETLSSLIQVIQRTLSCFDWTPHSFLEDLPVLHFYSRSSSLIENGACTAYFKDQVRILHTSLWDFSLWNTLFLPAVFSLDTACLGVFRTQRAISSASHASGLDPSGFLAQSTTTTGLCCFKQGTPLLFAALWV